MGAMAVPAASRERLLPSAGGWFAFERIHSAGDAVFWRTARKFESSYHRPSVAGMARAVGWMSMFVGLERFYERGARLARGTATGWRPSRRGGPDPTPPWRRSSPSASPAGRPRRSDELGARVFAVPRTIPAHRRRPDQRRVLQLGGGAGAVLSAPSSSWRRIRRRRCPAAHAGHARRRVSAPPRLPSANVAGRRSAGPVPERAAPDRPGRPVQPGRRGRPGHRLPRL